uniref:Fibronectin type-III domain-containing protein n=1 Tax=Haemonchus placei TaxID=6290 RepID=A0A0N4X6K5_HAEPC
LAEITKPLERETFGNEKKPVVLTVDLSRSAKDVIWTKNGNVITASEKFEMTFEGMSCSLTIKDSDSNDAGRYMVQVDESQSFTDLKISGKPKFKPCSGEVLEVGKSEDIVFSAEFDGQDDVIATCFFNGSPVREDSKTQLIVHENSVKFSKKQPTKADSGEYTVKLSGEFGEVTKAFTVKVNSELVSATHLSVQDLRQGITYEFKVEALNESGLSSSSNLPSEPLTITPTPGILLNSAKSDVTAKDALANIMKPLEAETFGQEEKPTILTVDLNRPAKAVKWTKDGEVITGSEKFELSSEGTSCSLTIKNVDVEDAGRYMVQVDESTSSTNLKISGKPKFKSCIEEVVEVGKNEDIMFSAEFDGQDDVVATCLFNGSPVREDSKTQLIVQENSVKFSKKQPTKADSGVYTVKLSGEFGEVTKTFTVKVKGVPGPLTGISVNKIKTNSISIAWEKPADDGGEPITGYLIKKKEAGRRTFQKVAQVEQKTQPGNYFEKLVSETNTSQVVDDLKKATGYVFSVAAINKYGVGESVETPVVTTGASFEAPQITQRPVVSDVSSGGCQLKWDQPSDDGGSPICGYNVFLRENAGEWTKVNSKLVTETCFPVKDLRQGVAYEFKVEALNKAGILSNSNLPSEPLTIAPITGRSAKNATPDVTAAGALATITKPLESETFGTEKKPVGLTVGLSGPAKNVIWTKDGNVITASEKFEMTFEGMSCSLTIKDSDSNDAGRYMVQVDESQSFTDLKISGKPKFKPCSGEVLEVGKSEDIVFSAEFDGQNDVIATCFFNGSPVREDSKTQLIVLENSVKFSKKQPTKADSGVYTVKLSGEFGEITRAFTVKVKDVPGPPARISVDKIGGNTISIAWEKPSDDGGEPITGYVIKKKEAGRRTFKKVVQVSDMKTSQIVEDLKMATDYVLSVAAINKYGVGEAVETPITTASPFKAPQIAQPPVISDVSSDSCMLKWDKPKEDGGSPICGYDVFLRENAGEWTKVNSELVSATHLSVQDLRQGITYEFKVEAVNESGISSNSNLPSEPLIVAPSSDMPGPPMGIAVNSVNDDSISISWEKPLDDGGEPITGYVIMGKEAGRRTFQKIAQVGKEGTVSDTKTSQIVDDLKMATGYVLSVAAINKYGVGETVETPVITTGSPFKAPLITQRPVVSDIRSDSCVLKWEKPEYDGGSPIYGYEVFLKENGGEWTKANNELIFATRFSKDGLRQGAVYEFKIEAVNEAGLMSNSGLSSEPLTITSTSGLPTTAPSVPRITITGTDSVTVDWDVPENVAPAGFTIAYKSESSPVWAEV